MKILKKEEVEAVQVGRLIMVYGPTGVGKTTSLLASVPAPCMYIQTEPRSLRPSLDAAARPDLDIDIAVFQDWSGLIEFVNGDNFQRHKTLILDSLSHLFTSLSMELENESFEARTPQEKSIKPLVSQTRLSLESYGGLASHGFRLMNALGRLSASGKIVIVTCLVQENPKYNRDLAVAPCLKGREFPLNCPSYFDLIGFCTSRTDSEGRIMFPPKIQFASPDDSFVSKFTGTGTKTEGPLNIKKILNIKE